MKLLKSQTKTINKSLSLSYVGLWVMLNQLDGFSQSLSAFDRWLGVLNIKYIFLLLIKLI